MDQRMPAGRGGGPGPVRKVSGPAPNPFVRSGVPVPVGSGPRLTNNVSQPRSYSSAVSGAGTVPTPPPSISTHKNATVNGVAPANERTFSDTAKTSCLFCIDPVIVAMREGGSIADNPEYISQLVNNLCDHMQLDHQQLPNEFTRIQFPFCDSCIEPIVELLECQKIIDDANARITTALATIEQIVADAEILNLDSSMQSMSSSAPLMDQQRFSKLRNMILEVDRKKLIMQKNLRKNLKAQVQPSEVVENMTTNVNPTDIDATTAEPAEESALQVGNDCESTQDYEAWRSDRGPNFSAHEDSPLPPDPQDDENSGIPVILNVRCGPSIVNQGTRAQKDVDSAGKNDPTIANFNCEFCPRKFTKKCYLSIHMKTHGSASNSKPPKLQKEKVRSYDRKKLHTESNNGIETNGSGASSSLPLPQLASSEIPAGASLDDIDIEESDMMDHSGESSSEWYINDQENGVGEVDDGSISDVD